MPWIVALLTVIADQALKYWTVKHLKLFESRSGIPYLFDFYFVTNDGAGWGILSGQRNLFIVLTCLMLAYFIYLIVKHRQGETLSQLAYGLLLGGGLGNLIDRLRDGYVIDMISLNFMDFPIFNLADMALTLGAVLLIIQILRGRDQEVL